MNKYLEMFMSENMIAEDGILTEIGLIALPLEQRTKIRESITLAKKITLRIFI